MKRDTVSVKVTTGGGLSGHGESYHARAPLAVAATVTSTLADLFTGMDAAATVEAWQRFESRVLAKQRTCAACFCAMSGIDTALGDIRGKAAEPLPPYRDRDYRAVGRIARVPLAASENCYCHAGLSMAASAHFLASIDDARYFGGDGSSDNPLRAELCSEFYELASDGTVAPLESAGLGVDVDEDLLRAHPSRPAGLAADLLAAARLPAPPSGLSASVPTSRR